MGMGGGCLLYPHSLLQFPSFSTFRKPYFPIKEISDRSLVLSIRADDGKKGRHKKNPYSGRAPKTEGADDNAQSFDGKSSLSPNKEEILALFKRIQSSISKGETLNPKKRTSKTAEDKPSSSPSASASPSAESILEVLHQSRTQRKGKSVGKKGDKFLDSQKDLLKEEESVMQHISKRPPSSFTRKSPIPSLSNPREGVQSENETIPATPTQMTGLTNEISPIDDDSDHQAMKFAEMKLPQLKEVAKSKGIKGYSKLKKSELIELLIKSLGDASP